MNGETCDYCGGPSPVSPCPGCVEHVLREQIRQDNHAEQQRRRQGMDSKVRQQLKTILASFTKEDLREASALMKQAWQALDNEAVRAFKRGDRVWFKSKTGKRIDCVVVRLNQKTVGVEAILTPEEKTKGFFANGWNVSGSYLHHADEEEVA